jgi:hypothetical protein
LSALEAQQKMAVSESALQSLLQNVLKDTEVPFSRQIQTKKPQTVTLNFFGSPHTISIGNGNSEFGDVIKKNVFFLLILKIDFLVTVTFYDEF